MTTLTKSKKKVSSIQNALLLLYLEQQSSALDIALKQIDYVSVKRTTNPTCRQKSVVITKRIRGWNAQK